MQLHFHLKWKCVLSLIIKFTGGGGQDGRLSKHYACCLSRLRQNYNWIIEWSISKIIWRLIEQNAYN